MPTVRANILYGRAGTGRAMAHVDHVGKVATVLTLLAIDFGTTNCKAGVFTADGRLLSIASRRTPAHEDGWGTVWHADEVWETVQGLVRQVVAESRPEGDVEAVSTSSVGESGVLLDRQRRPLYPIIAWYDLRTLGEVDFWAANFGEERLRRLTGLPLDPIYSVPKLQWMRRNAPEAVAAGRRFLLMADWLAFKLCGAEVTNLSLASRTMAFDLAARRWAESILDLAGLAPDIFAPSVPSGAVIGGLLPDVAGDLGLASGTPVVAGGHDHIVASLGAGLAAPGRLLNSTGTAETALVLVAGPPGNLAAPGLTLGCHVAPDAVYAMSTLRASGACTEWAKQTFVDRTAPPGDDPPLDRYTALLQFLEEGRAVDSGLLFLPLLRGSLVPEIRPEATGAFLGLRDSHRPADLVRAVFEGVCLEAAYALAYLKGVTGVDPERVIAVGGATHNPRWMQIKADVFWLPVDVPAVQEAALLGAAMLAGLGIGLYRDAKDAVNRTVRLATTYDPNPARLALWLPARERYAALRTLLLGR